MIVIYSTLVVSLTMPDFKRFVDIICRKRQDTCSMIFSWKMQTPQIYASLVTLLRVAEVAINGRTRYKTPMFKNRKKTHNNQSSIRHITVQDFPAQFLANRLTQVLYTTTTHKSNSSLKSLFHAWRNVILYF